MRARVTVPVAVPVGNPGRSFLVCVSEFEGPLAALPGLQVIVTTLATTFHQALADELVIYKSMHAHRKGISKGIEGIPLAHPLSITALHNNGLYVAFLPTHRNFADKSFASSGRHTSKHLMQLRSRINQLLYRQSRTNIIQLPAQPNSMYSVRRSVWIECGFAPRAGDLVEAELADLDAHGRSGRRVYRGELVVLSDVIVFWADGKITVTCHQ